MHGRSYHRSRQKRRPSPSNAALIFSSLHILCGGGSSPGSQVTALGTVDAALWAGGGGARHSINGACSRRSASVWHHRFLGTGYGGLQRSNGGATCFVSHGHRQSLRSYPQLQHPAQERRGLGGTRQALAASLCAPTLPTSALFMSELGTASGSAFTARSIRPTALKPAWPRHTSGSRYRRHGDRIRGVFGGVRPRGGTTALGMSGDVAELTVLGRDSLIFLAATCAAVPACIKMNISPVLGFLGTGALLGPAGFSVIKDLNELNTLGELGISFLLFEQGLELSLDRLKALSKYAFGLGSLQVFLSTLAFAAFPFLGGVDVLEIIFHSPAELVSIRRVDEAVVIGAALSLSSSAFVLKILQEKGQKAERFGRAVLGVLLLQDIAVVPLLVLLPIIETQSGVNTSLLDQLGLVGETVAKGVGGLGAILVAGRFLLRPVFDLVAGSRSSETFVALCLLVALGVGQLTEAIGLSSTLGAFAAGTLLAETNYRTQVEANIAPFRGLLLGLFFTTTGATVDPSLLITQWPTVLGLLLGLVTFKSIIISGASLGFGLKATEAVRTGLILSGGGEFAFVVLSLSQRLGVLPDELNRLLIGVVVLSMALTPALSSLGDSLSEKLTQFAAKQGIENLAELEPRPPQEGEGKGIGGDETVVICGFGPVGQIVGSLLSAPVIRSKLEADYVAFDLNPTRVRESRAQGFPVFYGDGTVPEVLRTAGIDDPKAVVVTYTNNEVSIQAVTRLHQAFPRAPIFARATDYEQYLALQEAGAEAVVSDLSEVSIRLGSELLESFGVARSDDVQSAKTDLRQTLVDLARKGDVKGDFSARFTPAMLNVKRDKSAADGPGSSQAWPEDVEFQQKLGVEICLLPTNNAEGVVVEVPDDGLNWNDDDDDIVEFVEISDGQSIASAKRSGEHAEQSGEPAERSGKDVFGEEAVVEVAVAIADNVSSSKVVKGRTSGGADGVSGQRSAGEGLGADKVVSSAAATASADGRGKSSAS